MAVVSRTRRVIPRRMLRSLAAGLALGALVGASPIAVTGALAQMHTPSTGPGQPEARIEATAREVSRAPYQARLATTCPSGGNRCDFTGAVVASGRRLEIQRVACRGDHSPIGATPPEFEVFAYAERGATGAAFLVDLPEVRYSQTNTAGIWTISQEALMFIPAGYRLHMYNSATTGVLRSIGCTVSGYMVTLGV